jgi:ribosomal protein S18 acetylase RimI-like enzyme
MSQFSIRKYKPSDRSAIREITYRTGFKGEDLTGRGYFDDKELWFLIFIDYYCRYEPGHFFVAQEAGGGAPVGFICGALDSREQERRYQKNMPWRILLRALLYTSWRYWRSFKNLLAMNSMLEGDDPQKMAEIYRLYPAHLHINILPEYQGVGLGARLMRTFETHLVDQQAPGVHLQTSNYNRKAVPFYQKMGFAIVLEKPVAHPTLSDFKTLVFAKPLSARR